MIPARNRITVEDMCEYMGIESLEKFEERRTQYCECQAEGHEYWDSSTNQYLIAKRDWTCESCAFDYRGKVIQFYSKLLAEHDLELDGGEENLTWKLVPTKNWNSAAKKLIETINGYGLFHFGSLKEAILSGPYRGARGFVLNHLSWIPTHSEVYGNGKAKNQFESWAFRR